MNDILIRNFGLDQHLQHILQGVEPFLIEAFNDGQSHFAADEYLDEDMIIGRGSERNVYELQNGWVLKIENGNQQSLMEHKTYQVLEGNEHLTKIISTEVMADFGIIVAEQVKPLYDYIYEMLDELEDNSEILSAVEQIHASDEHIAGLYEYGHNQISEDVFEELYLFADYAEYNGLQDMWESNIGARSDGTIVALDMGYGSSDANRRLEE